MSFSNAPDADTLGRVAGALAVDEAFIEKDWFVIQAIRPLVALATPDITPVFSGGTSLLKGYGLIERFSEDIDFKLALSDAFLARSGTKRRQALGELRDALTRAWEQAGFTVTDIEARDGNGFLRFEMVYPTRLEPHRSLRPHILAELSAKPPRLAPQERELASFVARFRGEAAEVPSIPCVDPLETAADKLSAFAWRVIARQRGSEKDDPTIVRHAHDLAVLETVAMADERFGALLAEALVADTHRGGGAVAGLPPRERLAAMRAKLAADEHYAGDYRRFVEAMAFAGTGEVPGYEAAVEALRRLCEKLPD